MELEKVRLEIEELNLKAKGIIELCNDLRITSQREIAGFHAGNAMSMAHMRTVAKQLSKLTIDPVVYSSVRGPLFVAFQEYVEAEVLLSIVDGKSLPELQVPAPCYFTGVCDAIGEVKRQFMIRLIAGKKQEALKLLDRCLKLSSDVAKIDSSPGVVPELKPKKDLVQRMVESMLELAVRTSK